MLEIPKALASTMDLPSITISNNIADNQIIYVNPSQGDDQRGRGNQNSPLRTITQALMLASPNSIIILSPGTYSVDSGETFPLTLDNNVTLQGSPRSQGYNVIIKGSGEYISTTSLGKNVTIVATGKAKLIGVTVTNPDEKGYALWLESAEVEISDNSFMLNGGSGVAVNGESQGVITRNRFFQNRGNGLIISGSSQVEVRDNTFEKTGCGVSVIENGKIFLENNQIIGNRVGVVVEGNGRAILRKNVIEQSTEDGLVALANAQVDLGTTSESGDNLFIANRGLDIRNLTPNTIVAVGTQLSGDFAGSLDFGNSLVVDSGESPVYIPVPPPEDSQAATTSYRVIVSVNQQQENQIRTLYPDAFATVYAGQRVLQVGLFSQWENAQQVLEALKELGLKEIIMLID